MSNIYIQEPPTHGKVLLVTTVGDIDIELWSKETPKACRNFVQLCLEGYYDGTIFHRVVKGFIAQGGDPTGSGTGGESIYGEPFKDEFHSRLRFNRRGLVAIANAGKDDNGSQFFFTLGACPELQNKHTIFAKVTGETLYNMLKLEDGMIDNDERPVYPQQIIKTEILTNPFPDIIPRYVAKTVEKKSEKKKEKKAGVKNFKLLSFGDEAEEDEEETLEISKNFAGRSKSTHDILDDPKLSAVPAVEKKGEQQSDESSLSGDEMRFKNSNEEQLKKDLIEIKNKLKRAKDDKIKENVQKDGSGDSDDGDYYLGKRDQQEKKRKVEEIRKEIDDLKRNYQKERNERSSANANERKSKEEKNDDEETLKKYNDDLEKYKLKTEQMPKKGPSREAFTLSLLAKFQKKLSEAKEKLEDQNMEEQGKEEAETEDDWMTHKLEFTTPTPVLAKDASTKDDEWFDITDPRNAINKRRREASKDILKNKEKRTF